MSCLFRIRRAAIFDVAPTCANAEEDHRLVKDETIERIPIHEIAEANTSSPSDHRGLSMAIGAAYGMIDLAGLQRAASGEVRRHSGSAVGAAKLPLRVAAKADAIFALARK